MVFSAAPELRGAEEQAEWRAATPVMNLVGGTHPTEVAPAQEKSHRKSTVGQSVMHDEVSEAVGAKAPTQTQSSHLPDARRKPRARVEGAHRQERVGQSEPVVQLETLRFFSQPGMVTPMDPVQGPMPEATVNEPGPRLHPTGDGAPDDRGAKDFERRHREKLDPKRR
jgi:hypothetical protein